MTTPQLTGAQLAAARDALVSAYYKWEQLDELADVALDINLEAEVGRAGGLNDIARALLKLTEASGSTEMLLREAVHRRPGNAALAALARKLGLAPAPFTNVVWPGLTHPTLRTREGSFTRSFGSAKGLDAYVDNGGFEAHVRPGGTEKTGQWRRTMLERERPVCQILLDGDAIGTGFLIGPDLVMSNHHVFEAPGTNGQLGALERYAARFDYRASDPGDVVALGTVVSIDKNAGYLDKSPKVELDYVIVKLVRAAAEDVTAGNTKRCWLTMEAERLGINDPAFVLQHPRGRTLELAVGIITGWEPARQLQIYEHCANTDEGSSGSPCFGWQWQLRGLHHRQHPETGRVNRAIATAAILERMAAIGTIGLLP